MHMRRFTRQKNGFSKKFANHKMSVALHFMYYNFVKIHKTLKCTPTMAAGVTPKLWEMKNVVAMIEAEEANASKNADLIGKSKMIVLGAFVIGLFGWSYFLALPLSIFAVGEFHMWKKEDNAHLKDIKPDPSEFMMALAMCLIAMYLGRSLAA